jgi:SOS response regulatory protein OraA/RecX
MLAKLDDFTRRRRLYAFLARRGFNPDEIREALDALGAATEE